jgi:hypothetical protein
MAKCTKKQIRELKTAMRWKIPAAAEIDEPRLIGMECEFKPCKSLAQDAKDPLGVKEVLERRHGIISEADNCRSPPTPGFRINHPLDDAIRYSPAKKVSVLC